MREMNVLIPENYTSLISPFETRTAVQKLVDFFTNRMIQKLQLHKITAPLIIEKKSGLSDNSMNNALSVDFSVREISGSEIEIVRSATKWKREVLSEIKMEPGTGILADITALRPDEILSNIHSLQADQWDWEMIISADQRNLVFLEDIVRKIYAVLVDAELFVSELFPQMQPVLPPEIAFVHSEDLAREYPELTSDQREMVAAEKYGAVFITGIGHRLSGGEVHGFRTADYDDWSTIAENGLPGLNGDIVVWNPVLERPLELSSMGIRVDRNALLRQVGILNCLEVLGLPWHKKLLEGKLAQTIGGGIGRSRVAMFLLRKAHIGEVQPGIWPKEMREKCSAAGIQLLK